MRKNLQFSKNALLVLNKRYLKKDSNGQVCETPLQMLCRVSRTIAAKERKYGASKKAVEEIEEEFFNMMARLEFMPNSPTLMNAGNDLGQLSACFVVPVEDSMESIFEAIKATALIHKTGGGTGFSFSRLRPKNSMVCSTGGVASGPVSFMKVFDSATQAVKQGGMRRGANMGILRVDHPDILEFIKCKQKEGDISNFNISVAVTDEFMDKVFKNETYDIVDPRGNEIKISLKAKEIFDLIVHQAWQNGEPGIVFIDKINTSNPVPHLGAIESTNPCGELPLLPYESCNLGSINLFRMLRKKGSAYAVDWDKLDRVTCLATRFLDNVIDANKFPMPEIREKTRKTRKIGLGVMGWATMLGFLGIPYDSEEALALAKKVMEFISSRARDTSVLLARERGVFPAWKESVWEKRGIRLRNATLTTIAPTGSISLIAGPASSGIEPFFSLVYFRNILDGEHLLEIEPSFEAAARERGFYSRDLMQRIAKGESIQNMSEIPEDIKNLFKTALEISPQAHVKMQAAFQEYTDNAVSKTINLPYSSAQEDVRDAFLYAFRLGCKGVTVYRDRSRQKQVLTADSRDISQKNKDEASRKATRPEPRPEVLKGTTTKITTGCGNLYVTVNRDEEGDFFEVFIEMGKAGGCAASQLEAIGRLISLALRGGLEIRMIIDQLKGIRCPCPNWMKGKKVFSCADAIAQVLESRLYDQKQILRLKVRKQVPLAVKAAAQTGKINPEERNIIGVCPECGAVLRHQEGCAVCDSCGFSKCL